MHAPPAPARALLPWREAPLKELLRLGGPMVISLVSLSLMTVVDTIFIGHLGASALAASGLGGVVVFTVVSFGLAVLGAAKVKVGEAHGRGKVLYVQQALGAFLRLGVALGTVSVALTFGLGGFLPLAVADPSTGDQAALYCKIRAFGALFALVSAALNQWLQAQGDSKTGMHAALLANGVNLPLNWLLIFAWGGGVGGAATATVIARIVELLWVTRSLARGRVSVAQGEGVGLILTFRDATWTAAWKVLQTGLPTGVERVLDMVAFAAVPLLLAQVSAAELGAHQIVLQIMMFSFLPLIALGEALSVLVSQAVGASAPGLVKHLTLLGTGVSLVYGALCATFVLALAEPLARAFTSDLEVIVAAKRALFAGALLQFINAGYNQLKGVLRGLSDFHFVAWVTVGCAWVITPPFTYLVGVRAGAGALGAWLVLCLEVTLGVFLLGIRLRRALSRLA